MIFRVPLVYRLVGGGYERQSLLESLDGRLGLHSEGLGLDLWAKGGKMRFRDPVTGLDLLSHQEEHVARQREATARRATAARAEREAAARKAAEARVAELEALIGGKRG